MMSAGNASAEVEPLPPDTVTPGGEAALAAVWAKACGECGRPGSTKRRVTGNVLCAECRGTWAHRLWSFSEATARTGITREDFTDLHIGEVRNPVDPRFARMRVAYAKDVLLWGQG